jgi:hypothetical protein
MIGVHSMIKRFRVFVKSFKKTKKSFGGTEKWITFAELSPEKIGSKVKRMNVRTEKFIEDI